MYNWITFFFSESKNLITSLFTAFPLFMSVGETWSGSPEGTAENCPWTARGPTEHWPHLTQLPKPHTWMGQSGVSSWRESRGHEDRLGESSRQGRSNPGSAVWGPCSASTPGIYARTHQVAASTGGIRVRPPGGPAEMGAGFWMCVHMCSVMSMRPHGLEPARLLCPWGSSRQKYWSGLLFPSPLNHFLLLLLHTWKEHNIVNQFK